MPADPTDYAQALADVLNVAATLARCQAFAGLDADKVTEATIERHIALARKLKSAHDVLARVVAGRPDQPTHTTPLSGEVTDHLDASEIAVRLDPTAQGICVDPLPALGTRVTVYAPEPHTTDKGDTP